MGGLTRLLEGNLKLKVNREKSAVARPWERKFLGFSFTNGKQPKRRIAPKAKSRFEARVRILTRRTRGISIEAMVRELGRYLQGWQGYFGFCQTPTVLDRFNKWIRRRIRSAACKQWRTGKTRYARLRELGLSHDLAQPSASLRPFHSRFASFQGWEIPLPLRLLPPAFARRRSACMYTPPPDLRAKASATAQGGSTHEHHRRSRQPVHRQHQQAAEADRERSNRGQRASPDRAVGAGTLRSPHRLPHRNGQVSHITVLATFWKLRGRSRTQPALLVSMRGTSLAARSRRVSAVSAFSLP